MLSRRIFLQGAAGVLATAATGAAAHVPGARPDEAAITIDSAATPLPAAARGRGHLHLTGNPLDRYNALKRLFAASPAARVRAHLDHADRVLLETALNDAGRALALIGDGGGASFGFILKAA